MPAEAVGLLERRLAEAGFGLVAGADEVGRGALAGPLFAAAVILPHDAAIPGLRDSKLCTRAQRERIAGRIREVAVAYSVVRVRHDRIDREGLNRCNLDALRRALRSLQVQPEFALVDCFPLRRLPFPCLAVKKGDYVSRCVAAASILAKVERDAAMRRYHRRFPVYGFATNAGYATRHHWDALRTHGPCEIHRRSYYGVLGFEEGGVFRPHPARHLGMVDPESLGSLEGPLEGPGAAGSAVDASGEGSDEEPRRGTRT